MVLLLGKFASFDDWLARSTRGASGVFEQQSLYELGAGRPALASNRERKRASSRDPLPAPCEHCETAADPADAAALPELPGSPSAVAVSEAREGISISKERKAPRASPSSSPPIQPPPSSRLRAKT